MKGLWKVLNSIIRNEFFVDKDNVINNTEDVVNGFNQFFVNVGPDLAEKN